MRMTIPETTTLQSKHTSTQLPLWQQELQKASAHFHVVGAWVAIIFDPLFGITDYMNIPDVWAQIFNLRIGVSIITLITLVLYYKKKINVYLLVAIPFALISLQNAYTYSLIESEDVLGHNLNYLALFLGAGLFVLWPLRYSIIAIGASFLTTLLFVQHNPAMQLSDLIIEGGLLLAAVAVFTILLIHARYRLRTSEIKAKLALKHNLEVTAAQKKEIEHQHEQLREKTQALANSEAQVRMMNAQLEEKVKARTNQLQQTNQEMDRLVYSLSHDFRTPITNVKGLLAHARSCEDPATFHMLLQHMETSTNRLDELQQDMINYAVYWREAIEPHSINLMETIQGIWQQFSYAHQGQVELFFDPTKLDDWSLFADQEKIRVLLYTLLSNSIRYRATDEPPIIKVSMREVEQTYRIEITDNGIGIEADQIKKVTQMFYRGTNKSMGAGMGLYVAKGIAQQLGGSLEISSKAGEGTSVTVILPVQSTKKQRMEKAETIR